MTKGNACGRMTVGWCVPRQWRQLSFSRHSEPVTDVTGVGIPSCKRKLPPGGKLSALLTDEGNPQCGFRPGLPCSNTFCPLIRRLRRHLPRRGKVFLVTLPRRFLRQRAHWLVTEGNACGRMTVGAVHTSFQMPTQAHTRVRPCAQ